jgi:hypothetical protein
MEEEANKEAGRGETDESNGWKQIPLELPRGGPQL